MITSFLSHFHGITGNKVVGPIRASSSTPVTITDTIYALTKSKNVKGIITGPCTLAYALKIDTPNYKDRDDLILNLAHHLHSEVKKLSSIGTCIIQVDKPILSTCAVNIDIAEKALRIMFNGKLQNMCTATKQVRSDL